MIANDSIAAALAAAHAETDRITATMSADIMDDVNRQTRMILVGCWAIIHAIEALDTGAAS